MSWVLSLVGGALALLTVRDMFHTLWQPRGFGAIAQRLFSLIWRATRGSPVGPALSLAGPLALTATAVAWTLGLVVGFALVYLPHVPEGFVFTSETGEVGATPVLSSLYVSVVALATLGFGDVTPSDGWLQLVVPLEALLGFVLLTAIISWVLQLYPALLRRRSLARRLASMAAMGTADLLPRAEASIAVQWLEDVRTDLATSEMDFAQYPESYYFHEKDRELSLAAQLPYVPRLVEAATRSSSEEVRHAGYLLAHGLEGFSRLLARGFFRGPERERTDPEHVVPTYAQDHGHL